MITLGVSRHNIFVCNQIFTGPKQNHFYSVFNRQYYLLLLKRFSNFGAFELKQKIKNSTEINSIERFTALSLVPQTVEFSKDFHKKFDFSI